jgi:hypothetical protein
MRRLRRDMSKDSDRRLYKRSTRKRRKGGVRLRAGRTRRRSLSVCAVQRQRWRRIPTRRGRKSGIVALSSPMVYSWAMSSSLGTFNYVVMHCTFPSDAMYCIM